MKIQHILYILFEKSNQGWLKMGVYVFISLFSSMAYSQKKATKKEVISITSSFKPSIIKTGKIEFYAAPPVKDDASFSFNYIPSHGANITTMTGFSVKPLAMVTEVKKVDSAGLFAKVGYGNIQNPFVQLAYQSAHKSSDYSIWVDHISAKGKLKDQQFGNSSLGFSFQNKINQSQKIFVSGGYDLSGYRLYGFDHSLFAFQKNVLLQRFNNASVGAVFSQLLGEENKTSIAPQIKFNFFSTNKSANEFSTNIKLPVEYLLKENLNLIIQPNLEMLLYSNRKDSSKLYSLFQVPLKASYFSKNYKIEAGIVSAIKKDRLSILPDLNVNYNIGTSDLSLVAKIKSSISFNSAHELYALNPFISSPDSLEVLTQSSYAAGVHWANRKGLELTLTAGYTNFKNLPLFVNTGISGKDMKAVTESSLEAITINGSMDYVFSEKFKANSTTEIFIFQGQKKFNAAYGFIPIKVQVGASWIPISPLKLRTNVNFWAGHKAGYEFKPDVRLKDFIDINLGVDYKLSKKWAIWLDLNNIANSSYQRWNQYNSFGFNMVGGFRYSFLKSKKTT